MNRDIKFYVNERDLEIIRVSLVEQAKTLSKLESQYPAFLHPNPLTETCDYVDDLLSKVRNLCSHYPYNPKEYSEKGEE